MQTEKQTVLIIDDEPNVRKTLSDILKMKGYETMTAASGAEGLALVAQGFINLVIINLGLPDMSGIEVLEKVRAVSPATEAIILTGSATLNSAIDATNSGAFSYLLKPCDIDQLAVHMSRAIDKQRANESIAMQSAELQKMNAELKALYEVSAVLSSTLDVEKLFPEILRMITGVGIFSVERKACIFLADEEGLRLASSIGLPHEALERCSRIKPHECLCGLALVTGEIIVSKNSELDDRHTIRYAGMTPHGHVIVPLNTVEKTVGVLCLYIAPDAEIDSKVLHLIGTIGNQMGTAVGNAKLYEETKSFSLHDPLTSLGNRRLLQMHMEKAVESARRYGETLSVLMLDIDHFKKYNDAYGHAEGDRLLVKLARILLEQMRRADWVFRYGGEEFLVMLPETGSVKAAEAAERLRKAVEELSGVTVSIGVASYKGAAETREELIERADSALYLAKSNGRNRVETDSG